MEDNSKADKGKESSEDRNVPLLRRGPRTEQGKSKSKYNHLNHGIFAKIVLSGEPFRESHGDFQDLFKVLTEEIKPANPVTQMLVELLAFDLLRMSRLLKADAKLAPQMFQQIEKTITEGGTVIREPVNKDVEMAFQQRGFSPELLLRYETTLTKKIFAILDRL